MRIALVSTDDERLACFDVLTQLRPELVRERFLEDVKRMGAEGYALAALWDDDVRAVAGFRPMEMFSTGKTLYVDDLVTAEAHRSKEYGAKLLAFLEAHALAAGCKFLELDSGLQRTAAHRFYRAQGMDGVATHFSKPLGGAAPWKEAPGSLTNG